MRIRSLPAVVLLPLIVAALAPLGSCASSRGPSPDAWQRIYGAPLEVVWRELLALLVDEGYVVESAEGERGRILAESSTGKEYRELALDLSVFRQGEVVKVTVDARTGAGDPGRWRSMEGAVLELLTLLDDRVRATRP